MEREYQIEGAEMTYRMPKEVDHHKAVILRDQMDRLIEAHQIRRLVLDFSETEFMDSSGIGVVIGRAKTMKFYGGTVEAVHLGERIQKICRASGLHRMITIKEEDGND